MARKKDAGDQPVAKIVRKLTTEKDLMALIKSCNSLKGQSDEINGELREKIGNAVEKKFLHKKAFAAIRPLLKMEAPALAEFLDHFDHYLEISGLRKRADDAPMLAFEEAAAEDEDDGREHHTKPDVKRANMSIVGGGGSVG
jgi:hypothetical protein